MKLTIVTSLFTLATAAFTSLASPSNLASAEFGRTPLTEEQLLAVESFNKLPRQTPYLRDMLPVVQRTVTKPVKDGIRLEIPKYLSSHAPAKLGIIDPTLHPFSADPTGKKDSTAELQRAINLARDAQMCLFLPAGDYRISDTLKCIQIPYLKTLGAIRGARNFPCILIGDTRDPKQRSRIILDANAEGFTNIDHRKYVIHFKALPWTNTPGHGQTTTAGLTERSEQPNISYNHVFRDIDIVIGEGNSGAIGISMRGAEGTSIQSINIDATHGAVGMHGAAGSGGSHHDISITGGLIGIDLREMKLDDPIWLDEAPGATQPGPTLSNVRLLDQKRHALVGAARGAITAVGWDIRSNTRTPPIKIVSNPSDPITSSFALIDSVVRNQGEAEAMIESSRSYYFENVYARGFQEVEAGQSLAKGWSQIAQFTKAQPAIPFRGHTVKESQTVDGEQVEGIADIVTSDAPPEKLLSAHRWPTNPPSWNSPGAANVKAAPYGAVGDAFADDTAAIQKAINENEIVFIPKGIYRITDSLQLKPNTKLIGIGQSYSVLLAADGHSPNASKLELKPVLQTDNSQGAETVISDLAIYMNYGYQKPTPEGKNWFYALDWQSGGDSLLRSVYMNLSPYYANHLNDGKNKNRAEMQALIRISGNGAGSIYNLNVHGYHHDVTKAPDYCHLLIQDRNGDDPLKFYHLHAQHAASPSQIRIENSSNIVVYGSKTESHSPFIKIANSQNISIHGFATLWHDTPYFIIENTHDFKLTTLSDEPYFRKKPKIGTFSPLKETLPDGTVFEVPVNHRPLLYQR